MNELPCMNCKASTSTEHAKFFAEVFVCAPCYEQASHFWLRLDRELHFLLVMAKEAIRVSLVEGRFSFPEGPAGEPSKREVLETIMKMEEARAASSEKLQCQETHVSAPPATRSTGSTLPSAASPAAVGNEGLPKAFPRG